MTMKPRHLSKLVEEMMALSKVKESEKVILVVPHVVDQRCVEAYIIALDNLLL